MYTKKATIVKDPEKKQSEEKVKFGEAIRTRRRSMNLTLNEVAGKTGLSVGFLSQVERNLTQPSLSSLVTIAKALSVKTDYFLSMAEDQGTVTYADERKFFSVGESSVQYARLTQNFPGVTINGVIVRKQPGFISETVCHEGEEMIYALAGEGFIVIGDEEYVLKPGDSAHFNSNIPHKWGTRGESECVWLWIATLPLFETSKGTDMSPFSK